jgi:hypothetical protein
VERWNFVAGVYLGLYWRHSGERLASVVNVSRINHVVTELRGVILGIIGSNCCNCASHFNAVSRCGPGY